MAQSFFKRFGPTALASTLLGVTSTYESPLFKLPYLNLFRQCSPAECWISDMRRKRLEQMNTNVYVWGEGLQVDIQ